jgi:hypothetical protein
MESMAEATPLTASEDRGETLARCEEKWGGLWLGGVPRRAVLLESSAPPDEVPALYENDVPF